MSLRTITVMSKERLEDLSVELAKIVAEIELIASCHRSVLITDNGYNESFGVIIDAFEAKTNSFRKKLDKIAPKLPSEKRKRKKVE